MVSRQSLKVHYEVPRDLKEPYKDPTSTGVIFVSDPPVLSSEDCGPTVDKIWTPRGSNVNFSTGCAPPTFDSCVILYLPECPRQFKD